MTTRTSDQMLLRTKVYRPRLTADLVHRPRLFQALNDGLDRPLILVAAPAGFGKSTLLAAWLETLDRPHAWLSLDENDNDLGIFLAYFLAAVQTVVPDALSDTRALVSGVNLPAVELIARSLANALDGLERDFVLVLDDYHTIREQSIHELLSIFLRHPPKGLHLVVTARRNPPLPLGMLRARNQVVEIRGQDLRFSVQEVAAFMARTLGAPLAEDAVAVLAEKTEGWAVGLRLAMLTLRYSEKIDSQIAQLHAENRFVTDYLISEVQTHIPPVIQSFALKTSILDRLCGPLCSEVIGRDSADCQPQACLEWLEESGMFTTAMDTQRQWYRYHNLFQEFWRAELMRQSGADEIAVLHLRASAWFAANGFIEEALQHSLAGGDMAAAVALVARHRHALMNDEQWQRLERWLARFPAEMIEANVDLLLLKAWLADLDMAGSALVGEMLDRAGLLLAQMTDPPERICHLRAELDALRVKIAASAARDPEGLLALSLRVLQDVPKEWYLVRMVAWLRVAFSYQLLGSLDRAHAALNEGAREDAPEGGPVRGRIRGSGCFVHWMAGDLPAVQQTALQFLEAIRTARFSESYGWGHLLLGMVAYHRNDLDAAEAQALIAEEMRYAGNPMAGVQSMLLRALIHQARNQPERACLAAANTRSYLIEIRREQLLPYAEAFQAELAMMQADLATANSWATRAGNGIPLAVMSWFYQPQLALPKIRLAQDTPASRRQAAEALTRLYDFVTATHNTRFTIEVLALQALLQDAQGDERAALALLKQAVLMAEPGGFIRLFADLGPRMARLLIRLRQMGVAADYVDRTLPACDGSAPAAPAQRAAVPASGRPELIEPLTDREREVLALLDQRLSNKEIAQALVISPQTVKRHTVNLYQKLQVNGRREAVSNARRLGLL